MHLFFCGMPQWTQIYELEQQNHWQAIKRCKLYRTELFLLLLLFSVDLSITDHMNNKCYTLEKKYVIIGQFGKHTKWAISNAVCKALKINFVWYNSIWVIFNGDQLLTNIVSLCVAEMRNRIQSQQICKIKPVDGFVYSALHRK